MDPRQQLRLAAGHPDSGAVPPSCAWRVGLPSDTPPWENVRWLLPSFGRKGGLAESMMRARRGSELKDRGNEAFRAGRVAEAAEAYKRAMEILQEAPADSPECGALHATVMSNLAACGLRDLEASGMNGKLAVVKAAWSAATTSAYAPPALRARAYERLARALRWSGQSQEEALEAAECAADLGPMTEDLSNLLKSLGTPAHRPPNMRQIIGACGTCDDEDKMSILRDMLNQGLRPKSKHTSQDALQVGVMGPIDMICGRLHHVDIRVLSLFLEAGADPNSRREDSITPLMNAANACHLEGLRLLLDAGADIDAADAKGFSALMVACHLRDEEEVMETFGRRVGREEHHAMVAATVELLISRGACVRHQSLATGKTALHLAAISRNAAACRALLDAGAMPSAVSHGLNEPGDPGVAVHCALHMALLADKYRTPECEAAAVIRERMLAGSDHDRAVARAVDWEVLRLQMVSAFNGLCPPEGERHTTEEGGAAEAAVQLQGMAEWMARHAGVEAPGEAAGNPLLAIHRHMHDLMPREMQTVWHDMMDMTGEEIDILWLMASCLKSPPLMPVPVVEGFLGMFPGYEDMLHDPLCLTYAFGIPNDEALGAIAALGPIVEIGAGTGYWAALLRQRGCDVVAYDIAPPSQDALCNRFFHKRYSEVLQGGPGMAAEHGDRALLLVWPWSADDPQDSEGRPVAQGGGDGGPRRKKRACASCGGRPDPGESLRLCSGCKKVKYCSRKCQKDAWKGHKAACRAAVAAAAAAEASGGVVAAARPWDVVALEAYAGDVVIYAGEWEGRTLDQQHKCGVSSSPEFQAALSLGFSCVRRVPLPNYRNVRDDLSVWRRKGSS